MGLRRGSARRPESEGVEVVLLDAWQESDSQAAGTASAQDDPGTAPRRPRRWWVLGAVVLALVVVGVNVVEVRRENARIAALRDVPGVLAPIEGPLTEQWRVPGAWVAAQTEDLLVLADGTGGVTAVESDGGTVQWTYGTDNEPWSTWCMPTQTGDLLVCVGQTQVGSIVVDAVDVREGTALHSAEFSGGLVNLTVDETHLVVALSMSDGRLQAYRWDAASGSIVWSYRSPDQVLGQAGAGLTASYGSDGMFVIEGERRLGISLDDGQEIDEPEVDRPTAHALPWHQEEELPDGGRVVWRDSGDGTGEGEVVDADGTVRFTVPDAPVLGWVRDDSDPDVLLLQGDAGISVRAVHARTGAELWERSGGGGFVVLRVDGVALAVTVDADAVVAFDVRTGTTLWERPARGWSTVATDGRVVLLHEPQNEAGDLVAYGLRDGEERWRTALPLAVASGFELVHGGRLVVSDGQWVVGLG